MQILKVVIWPVRKSHSVRIISLNPSAVNFIVGESQTGKSNLWIIIDFCFGSSSFHFPLENSIKIIDWCGLITADPSTPNEQTLIARSISGKYRPNSLNQLVIHGKNIDVPNEPIGNINFNEYMNQIKQSFPNLPLLKQGRISFRDFVLFNSVSQYSIGNPKDCFPLTNYGFSNWKVRKFIAHLAGEVGFLSDLKISKELDRVSEKGTFLRPYKDRIYHRAIELVLFKVAQYDNFPDNVQGTYTP